MYATSDGLGDLVGHALTAMGMILSVGIVVLQLAKQHKSSLKLQRSNAKEALKLKVYEIISEKVLVFAEAESDANSYAGSIARELDSHVFSLSIGLKRSPSELRADRLSELHYIASSALIDLIVAIENWEIALPNADLFRLAISSANHDVEDAFHPFFNDIVPLLPTDLGEKGLHVPQLPTSEMIEELKKKAKAYTDAQLTLRTYTQDLIVEAQNLLLSKLFKRRVEIRRPIDPSFKVITTRDAAALKHYFLTETAAGKSWEEAKNRTRRALRDSGREPTA